MFPMQHASQLTDIPRCYGGRGEGRMWKMHKTQSHSLEGHRVTTNPQHVWSLGSQDKEGNGKTRFSIFGCRCFIRPPFHAVSVCVLLEEVKGERGPQGSVRHSDSCSGYAAIFCAFARTVTSPPRTAGVNRPMRSPMRGRTAGGRDRQTQVGRKCGESQRNSSLVLKKIALCLWPAADLFAFHNQAKVASENAEEIWLWLLVPL